MANYILTHTGAQVDEAVSLALAGVQDGSITAAKIQDGSITPAKLSSNIFATSSDVTTGTSSTTLVTPAALSEAGITPGAGVPVGWVGYYATNAAPSGYLKCNGAAISRSTYSALFAVIGTTFGAGDGSTTFKLPDGRGLFLRGWDDGKGIDPNRVFGSTQSDLVGSHSHTVGEHNDHGNTNTNPAVLQVGSSSTASLGTGATGLYGGSETRPRNIALLACIKY